MTKLYLGFDTETTNLPNKDQYGNPHHENSPLPVSVAAVLLDENFREVSIYHVLVKSSRKADPGAAAVHGITQEDIDLNGIPLAEMQQHMAVLASSATHIFGHNIAFDRMVLQATYNNPLHGTQTERPAYLSKDNVPYICTMHSTTKICQLPGPRGFKWPKLHEAYKHLFDEDLSGAHDALVDIRATARIFEWLVKEGHINL